MRDGGTIMAVDLASFFGLVEGAPGGDPRAMSNHFAPEGSGHAAIGAGAVEFFADRFALSKPSVVFVERPGLHSVKKGKSSFDVIFRLLGLCFLVHVVAYMRGIYDVRFVRAEDWRLHFLGSKVIPGERAKALACQRCRELGWAFKNADEAEALGLWDYGCELVKPGTGHPAVPGMFGKAAPIQRKPKAPPLRMSAAEARSLFKPRRGQK